MNVRQQPVAADDAPRLPARAGLRAAAGQAYRLLKDMLALLGLLVLLFHSSFVLCQIRSGSMAPTLVGEEWKEGDVLLCERWSYRFRKPKRWEVVTFRRNDGEYISKRIVGLPGETLLLHRNGNLEINGKLIQRPPYLEDRVYLAFGNMADQKPFDCEGGYYVLGDDSKDSDDSRFNGTVPTHTVLARAWLILSPWSRAGFVY